MALKGHYYELYTNQFVEEGEREILNHQEKSVLKSA
jgi:hypothetical protein